MERENLFEKLKANSYPGRGIVLGRSGDGEKAVIAYFIMGRSSNSRNRIFAEEGTGLRTEAFDASKLEDPSLIIYAPVRVLGNRTIVTNGDQTDTVYESLQRGGSFEEALRTREFEPDAPNYTPRISGLVTAGKGACSYTLSILKSNYGDPGQCLRFFYEYEAPAAGEGHFIHTYMGDGNPLPGFEGEPERVALEGGIDDFSQKLWEVLNPENRVSLFVRYIPLSDPEAFETRIINRHTGKA
ncbi:MAG: IMP cyclohydrolase [Lachnospiraceae bacterium]|nr:IMP cyclohydrolase [Lachnospiraceae bacterium]